MRILSILQNGGDSTKVHFTQLFLMGLPFVLISILLGLCVPGCGYFGAKQLHPNLLCCFWSCSCCSAFLGTLGSLLGVVLMTAAIPMADNWLTVCDPATVCCGEDYRRCSKAEGNLIIPKPEFEKEFMDCVLGAHGSYHQKMTNVPHLKEGFCAGSAKIVTECKEETNPYGTKDEELEEHLRDFRARYPRDEQFIWSGPHVYVEAPKKRNLFEVFAVLQRRNLNEFDKLRFVPEHPPSLRAFDDLKKGKHALRHPYHVGERLHLPTIDLPEGQHLPAIDLPKLEEGHERPPPELKSVLDRFFNGKNEGLIEDLKKENIHVAHPKEFVHGLRKEKDPKKVFKAVTTASPRDVKRWVAHPHGHQPPHHEDFETCTINPKALTVMKVVHDNLPDLVTEVELVLMVKLLIGIPMVILAMISTYYGYKLWKQASRGYRPTFAPSLVQPMISVQEQQQPYEVMYPPVGNVNAVPQVMRPGLAGGQAQQVV